MLIYPEWWYTPTLATTDNAALFWIVTSLWAMASLSDASTPWTRAGLGAVLGTTAFVAHQLRSIGISLMLAAAAYFVGSQKQGFWFAAALLLAVASYALLVRGLLSLLPPGADDPSLLWERLTALDLQTRQDFTVVTIWMEHFWSAVPAESRLSVGLSKVLTQILVNYHQIPIYIFRKAGDLFLGTGYLNFASVDMSANADTLAIVSKSTVPASSSLFTVARGVVVFQLMLAAAALLTRPLRWIDLAGVMFLAVLLAFILPFGEAQPRYSVLLSPSLALLGSLALSPMPAARGAGPALELKTGVLVLSTVAVICCGVILWLRHSTAFPLEEATQGVPKVISGSECNDRLAVIERSAIRARLTIAPDSACASVVLPIPPNTTGISFFVTRDAFASRVQASPFEPFRFVLSGSSGSLASGGLAEASATWVGLAIPPTQSVATSGPLEFVVFRAGDISHPLTIDLIYMSIRIE